LQEGHEAVRLLLQRIEDPSAVLPPVSVPFTFIPGETIPRRGVREDGSAVTGARPHAGVREPGA